MAANRCFVVSGEAITITTANPLTLVFINPAASGGFGGIRIRKCWASQGGTATSEQQSIKLVSQVTAFPTLTSVTPAKLQRQDPNAAIITGGTAGAAGTAGINATVEGAGTKTTILADAFNNLLGWVWQTTPQDVIEFAAGSSSGFGMVLTSSPTGKTNWNFGVEYEEI